MNFRHICFILTVIPVFLFSGCAALFLDDVEFEEYEIGHYTFYYLKGSKIERDIGIIASESEKAAAFADRYLHVDNVMKLDGYLLDSKDTFLYKRLFQNPDATVEIKTGFHLSYERDNYDPYNACVTILHETVHSIQSYLLFCGNDGINEGYAFYAADVAYMKYKNSVNSDYPVYYVTRNMLMTKEDLPSKLFSMTANEFQQFDIIAGKRDPGYRYQISGSFISFIANRYGIDMLNRWLYDADRFNYAAKFEKVFPASFSVEEGSWLELMKEKFK